MKFVVSIKHCDPYDWNKFVSHVKILIIIISQMGVFGGDDHTYLIINIVTNYHFQMENDKICEVGYFLNFNFKHFFG
jgi:hypothetical protein